MIISPNKIMGSLVYRTREALNTNMRFINKAKEYEFAPDCFIGDKFSFWHYPGTQNEISTALISHNRISEGRKLKFPSLFNFQPIRQRRDGDSITVYYNLAFVAPVVSKWFTEEREREVFDPILRPVYETFMDQVNKSGYFIRDYGMYPPHNYLEVFTTGENGGELVNRYSEHIDAIEIHDMGLLLRKCYPDDVWKQIEKENSLVTETLNELI